MPQPQTGTDSPSTTNNILPSTSNEWKWAPRVDPNCTEYGLFVNQNNQLHITPGSPNAAITSMRIILNNQFAPMPVMGHGYASAQFIGRGSTECSMQITGLGDGKLSDIQAMHEELEENARIFRRFDGAARVRFHNNEFLQLAGIEDGIISSIDTETDSGGTNLYRMQVSFTSDGHHNENFNQEMHLEYEDRTEILETLLRRIELAVVQSSKTDPLVLVPSSSSPTGTRPSATAPSVQTRARGTKQVPNDPLARAKQRARVRRQRVIDERGPDVLPEIVRTTEVVRNASGFVPNSTNLRGTSNNSGAPKTNNSLNSFESLANSLTTSNNRAVNQASRERAVETLGTAAEGANPQTSEIGGGLLGGVYVDKDLPRDSTIPNRIGRSRAKKLIDQILGNGRPLIQEPIRINVNDSLRDQAYTGYILKHDSQYPWIDEYVQECIDIFRRWEKDLPPQTFIRGSQRGQYLDYRGHGPVSANSSPGTEGGWRPKEQRLNNWPPMLADQSSLLSSMIYGYKSRYKQLQYIARPENQEFHTHSLEGNLWQFETELTGVAARVQSGANGKPGYNDLFPGAIDRYINSNRSTVHPTYPDLDLPNHPVTGFQIDTEPDYYFFNDSEEGMLNRVGPAIIQDSQERIDKMEWSYSRLNNAVEWKETYLGRNRFAVSSFNESQGITLNTVSGDKDRKSLPYFGMEGNPNSELDPEYTDNPPSISSDDNSKVDNIVGRVMGNSPMIQGSNTDEVLAARRKEMLKATSLSLPQGRSRGESFNVGPIDNQIQGPDKTHSFSKQALKEIALQSIAQAPEETLTMRRAFPSFKIYFIEDDTGAMRQHLNTVNGQVRTIMFFDDLYNYNSVKSIRLVRSRKNPTDLLVLELTNVQGLLERRRWKDPRPRKPQRELYFPGFEETEMENPLKKIVMKEGLKVQARLGYSNDANKMGIKFIGEIVETSYNAECPDQVTLICQSYGAELTLEPKGTSESSRIKYVDTPDLVHTLMCSPDLVHFGRFEINPQFNPAEARSAATSRNDPSTGVDLATGRFSGNPAEFSDNVRQLLVKNRSKWILANNPSDDNIFAPGIKDHLSNYERFWSDIGSQTMWSGQALNAASDTLKGSLLAGILTLGGSYGVGLITGWVGSGLESLGNWLNSAGFSLTGQTIWEVLKECELRHPGWVAQPRPYGTRQTMFFGVPSHRYWADQISRAEMVILNQLREQTRQQWQNDPVGVYQAAQRAVGGTNLEDSAIDLAILSRLTPETQRIFLKACFEIADSRQMNNIGEYIGDTLGRFRPFRRYHLLTSDHHILMNNIRASKRGTFNGVSLRWANGNTYNMKADDDIPDELTRVQSFHYPSCNNETLARRYCIGLLVRHLKDIYKGEIVTIGMDVDPVDMCYIQDDRTGMYGAFEIEQVVDTFTAQTGWITEITPDLITGTNEWSTMSTAQARWAVLGALGERLMGRRIGVGTVAGATAGGVIGGAAIGGAVFGIPGAIVGGGLIAAGASLAWMGGYQLIRWTQDRQPIWVAPLIIGERPFITGLDGFKHDGFYVNVRGDLHASYDAMTEGWRRFHLAGYANDIAINVARHSAGQDGS